MFELTLAATALVLIAGMLAAHRATGDVLHPMMFLGPLFLYSAALEPWLVRGDLPRYFTDPNDVLYVATLNLCAVTALVLGTLRRAPRHARVRIPQTRALFLAEKLLLPRVALVLAICGLAAYSVRDPERGWLRQRLLPGEGGRYSTSGYLTEAMNLSLVAAVMIALSRLRRGWTIPSLVVLAVALIPHLLQGTFGGRRGPLFLAVIRRASRG